jgi:hypothetical protein
MLIITRRSVVVGGRLKLPSPLHTIINNLQSCSENVVCLVCVNLIQTTNLHLLL